MEKTHDLVTILISGYAALGAVVTVLFFQLKKVYERLHEIQDTRNKEQLAVTEKVTTALINNTNMTQDLKEAITKVDETIKGIAKATKR